LCFLGRCIEIKCLVGLLQQCEPAKKTWWLRRSWMKYSTHL
jgi:hypothetical protein